MNYLQTNTKVVSSVASKLSKLLADFNEQSDTHTKEITSNLTSTIKKKDSDIRRMRTTVIEAQDLMEKVTKDNGIFEKTVKHQDVKYKHLDTMRRKEITEWQGLSNDFASRITHLEKLLAQSETTSKMMEQILRASGLELQMELKKEGHSEHQEEEDDDDTPAHMQKLMLKINDLADKLQAKEMELAGIARQHSGEMAKAASANALQMKSVKEREEFLMKELEDYKERVQTAMEEERKKMQMANEKEMKIVQSQLEEMRQRVDAAEAEAQVSSSARILAPSRNAREQSTSRRLAVTL